MKSGRKRKPGRREPSGRCSRAAKDSGTPELQMVRARLVGAADPALASHPLGILYARGIINRRQYDAGRRYAFLFAVTVRKPHQPVLSLDGGPLPASWGEDTLEDMTAHYNWARSGLAIAGYGVKAAVEAAAVYEEMPAWLGGSGRGRADVIRGLNVLAGRFGY